MIRGHRCNDNNSSDTCDCLICMEPIVLNSIHISCMQCQIRIHSDCERKHREHDARNYTLCPHCQGVGNLVIDKKIHRVS